MASDIPNESPVQLIFGASGGIGSEVCRRLTASGATVALASRPSDRLDQLARQLNAPKWDLDVHEPTRIEAAVAVASCITWLLDPANAWVTGQVIGVDGGLGSIRSR